jgi:hypothetical protein
MAALLPLFAVSVLPTQLRMLICRFTGAVMDVETCCPTSSEEKTQAETHVSEPGCCVVKTVDLRKLVAECRSEGAPPPELSGIPAMSVVGLVLPKDPAPDVRQVRPPPVGPPLLLLKRSFLI